MKELKSYIIDEIESFKLKYTGTLIAQNITDSISGFETWLDHKKQHIQDYYKNIDRQENISIIYCWKSFKIRMTFLKDGELKVTLEYSDICNFKVKEKRTMKEYKSDPGYVYFLESEFGWKIGKTRDLKRRRRIFDVKLPFKFAIRYCIKTPLMNDLEKYFHEYFKNKNINGEWFLICSDDIKKCIELNPENKLKGYHNDKDVFIDRKYLNVISKKVV